MRAPRGRHRVLGPTPVDLSVLLVLPVVFAALRCGHRTASLVAAIGAVTWLLASTPESGEERTLLAFLADAGLRWGVLHCVAGVVARSRAPSGP